MYIRCRDAEPDYFTCKTGQLFDSQKLRCADEKKVDCGPREYYYFNSRGPVPMATHRRQKHLRSNDIWFIQHDIYSSNECVFNWILLQYGRGTRRLLHRPIKTLFVIQLEARAWVQLNREDGISHRNVTTMKCTFSAAQKRRGHKTTCSTYSWMNDDGQAITPAQS